MSSNLLSKTVVDVACQNTLGVALLGNGFTSLGARRWARRRIPVATDILELQTIKGAVLSPRWGFCVMFVPSVQGGRLRWHRDLESATLQLIDDPLDTLPDATVRCLQANTLATVEQLHAEVSSAVPTINTLSEAFFQRVTLDQHLLSLCSFLRDRPSHRFGFSNYIQQPFAHACILARLGHVAAAQEELRQTSLWLQADTLVRAKLERAVLASARPAS